MKVIGFLTDIVEMQPLKIAGWARALRAIPIDSYLKMHGINLFIYSPKHINPNTGLSSGYMIVNKKYVPIALPIPTINGNWYSGSYKKTPNRSGLTLLNGFKEYTKANHIEIYPSYKFADIVKDKLRTFELIYEYDQTLHPYTEPLQFNVTQIEAFLNKQDKIFIKPNFGSKGNSIAILTKKQQQYELSFYKNKQVHRDIFESLSSTLDRLNRLLETSDYIIQDAIESLRYKNLSTSFRTTLVQDGKKWYWDHEMTVSTSSMNDVINTYQGSQFYTLEALLPKLCGEQNYDQVFRKLKNTVISLAEYLDSKFPNQILEVAFDLVLNKKMDFHLIELNLQPGIAKPEMNRLQPFQDYFNISDNELYLYNKYIVPPATYMARFLLRKFEGRI